MAFDSFSDFLAMGRHGFYVWSAYGVTFAIVGWNAVQPVLQRRRLLREQLALHKRASRGEKQKQQL
jgi:heme exporter protein D